MANQPQKQDQGQPQVLTLKIHGLYTNPSQFGEVPPSSIVLKQADDVVIDRESIVATRRGNKRYGSSFGAVSDRSLFPFKGAILTQTSDGKMWYDSNNLGSWVAYTGTFSSPSAAAGSRIRSVEANKNFYFTSSQGIYKLDTVASTTPLLSGAPKAFGGVGSVTGASGFMSNTVNVAYRIVWGYMDANKNLILGPPSERIIVSNNAGHTSNVSLTFQLPQGITTTWFYQLYRSGESASLTDPPTDELQQTYEANPTSGEITAGSITVTDTTPNSLLQATLYTSPSQGGINNANWRPPFANDIAQFKTYTFFANTRTLHRLFQTLVASGSPLGIQNGDTITLTDVAGGSFTLTGGAAENVAAGIFKVFSSGNPAIDIQNTSQSLIKVCNLYTSNTFINAFYMSDFAQLPGQILFEKRTLDANLFYVNSSRQTPWTPTTPTSGIFNESQNDVAPNALFYSRELQPESVPLLNYVNVGSANVPIDRILALRDGLIILKRDGVYRLSGLAAPFTVALLDNTVNILAANTADVLENQVYFLSDQGIVSASDNGVAILSRPIEQTILQHTSPNLFPNFKDLAFGCAYNSARRYILSLPGTGSDTYCTQQYVYNFITGTWTRWTRPATCMMVNPTDGKLYTGGPNDATYGGSVFQERKDFALSDYADEEYPVSITSFSGNTVHMTSTADVKPNFALQQTSIGGITADVVRVINSTTVTVDLTVVWDIGPAVVYAPIVPTVTTIQQDCGNPGIMKQVSEISFLFMESNFEAMTANFNSDMSVNTYPVTLIPISQGSWGNFNWGMIPWGGSSGGQCRIRKVMPQPVQRCNWFNVQLTNSQAFTSFGLSGVSVQYNAMSSRQK
jgi:hypothetical protein